MQASKRARREANRRKRLSAGSVGKRTFTESIGDQTDEEDLELPMPEGMDDGRPGEPRRLRRKTNESMGNPTARTPTAGIFAGLLSGATMGMGRAGDRNSLLFADQPLMGVLTEVAGEDDDLDDVADKGVEVPDVDEDVDVDVFVRELRGYGCGSEVMGEAMDIDSDEDE